MELTWCNAGLDANRPVGQSLQLDPWRIESHQPLDPHARPPRHALGRSVAPPNHGASRAQPGRLDWRGTGALSRGQSTSGCVISALCLMSCTTTCRRFPWRIAWSTAPQTGGQRSPARLQERYGPGRASAPSSVASHSGRRTNLPDRTPPPRFLAARGRSAGGHRAGEGRPGLATNWPQNPPPAPKAHVLPYARSLDAGSDRRRSRRWILTV